MDQGIGIRHARQRAILRRIDEAGRGQGPGATLGGQQHMGEPLPGALHRHRTRQEQERHAETGEQTSRRDLRPSGEAKSLGGRERGFQVAQQRLPLGLGRRRRATVCPRHLPEQVAAGVRQGDLVPVPGCGDRCGDTHESRAEDEHVMRPRPIAVGAERRVDGRFQHSHYPLTAPLVRPEMSRRPNSKKARTMGRTAKVADASKGPQSRPKNPMFW